SVKITLTPLSCIRSRISCSMSSAQRPGTATGMSCAPRPVITSTAETSPDAKSPCPATMARAAGRAASRDSSGRSASGTRTLLIILLQVPSNLGSGAHRLEQPLVEALCRIDAAVLQQMIHRDHFGDNRNVLSGIQGHGDLRERYVENRRPFAVQARAIDHQLGIPIDELDDHLDTLLLTHGADAEHRWHVDQADAANLHVVSL